MTRLFTLASFVGKTILGVTKLEDDLYLETDSGSFRLAPYGDCCAHCYIQHVSGADALAPGAVVMGVEDIAGNREEPSEYDVSDTWGHRIATTKGTCSIEMRVDHNGYYGGSLEIYSHEGALPGVALDDF